MYVEEPINTNQNESLFFSLVHDLVHCHTLPTPPVLCRRDYLFEDPSASAPAAPSLHTLVLLGRVEGVDAGVGLTLVNRRKNASISCPTQRLVSMQSAASGCE